MFQNTLSKNISNITETLQISKNKKDKLSKFLSIYYKNTNLKYIYVSKVSKILDYDIELSYKFLEKLVDNGILLRRYEFRCPCGNHRELFTTNYINLPDYVTCHECQKRWVTKENIFIVYEVIQYDK